jgi:MFS family permease
MPAKSGKISKTYIVGYIKNKQINLLNLHTSLVRFAVNVISIFGIIYLIKQGIPIYFAFLFWSLTYIIRILVRPFSLRLQEYLGLKKGLILGTLFYAGIFPILSQIDGIGIWLYFFVIYLGISDTLYWLPFHSYYAALGDVEHRGKHIGVREALTTIFSAIAPFFGGLLITQVGFWATYAVAGTIMLIASIPIFLSTDCSPGEEMTFKKARKELDMRGFWLLFGDSLLYAFHGFLWPVVLYLIVQNYIVMGGFISFEMILIALLFLLLGHYFDRGKGKNIINTSFILFTILILGRSFYVQSTESIMVFQILAAFALCFHLSCASPIFYNLAKKSHNTLWFHFLGEIGWDIGAFLALALTALWTSLGFELRYVMPMALIGLLIVRYILYSYYKE